MTRRATKPQAKSAATLRAEAVLPWGFVAQSVEYRPGYTPSLAPRPRAKRLSANCILSYGLVSMRGPLFPLFSALRLLLLRNDAIEAVRVTRFVAVHQFKLGARGVLAGEGGPGYEIS